MIRCHGSPPGFAKILKHISHRAANRLIESSVLRTETLCQYSEPASEPCPAPLPKKPSGGEPKRLDRWVLGE